MSYLPAMPTVRTALYLDFDNVFGGLLKLDPKVALRFAREPAVWVDRLKTRLPTAGGRRWLVLRCYMNPAGSVPHPELPGERLHFDGFRLPFTDAGFEVVDCPRLAHAKNGADIRMVLDAAEAMAADVRYDEFVIASGDSDMTPLLVRLRAADRRTTVVSASDSAVVLAAIADRLVRGEDLLELFEDDPTAVELASLPRTPDQVGESGADADPFTRFRRLALEHYRAAGQPLNLATLAHLLRAEVGPVEATNCWFGHTTLTRALQALDLPGLRVSHNAVWDSRRHDPPEDALKAGWPEEVPAAGERVSAVLRLPRLAQASWGPIYWSLAAHVASHDFNLAETTRWARDRLADGGVEVGRKALGDVARGAAYGGCPLYESPPPKGEQIAAAFVANIVDRARHSDVDLTEDDVDVLRDWFGVPQHR